MKKLSIFFLTILALNAPKTQPPVITSFSPASGAVGTLIPINGTSLSSPSSFTISGIPAVIVSSTATILVGLVMPGNTTGNISVTTVNGAATSENDFTVTATSFPSIQQGDKLASAGAIGMSQQGSAVSVGADGNMAIVGGFGDNDVGAAWIFTSIVNTPVQSYIEDNDIINPFGANLIQGNAAGCSKVWEVEAACESIGTESDSQIPVLSIIPNPSSTSIIVQTTIKGTLSIIDLSGKRHITRRITEPKTQLDTSTLPSGVYFVRIVGEKRVEMGKIIKQ